jgi:hypothetical protein
VDIIFPPSEGASLPFLSLFVLIFDASGDSGDIFRLPLGGSGNSTDLIHLDGKDYVAFDLEWTNHSTGNNRTIYAAAFVDSRGNQKVLHISDFGNSGPALIQAITDETLKYPAPIRWYTTGIAKGSGNHKGRKDVPATEQLFDSLVNQIGKEASRERASSTTA